METGYSTKKVLLLAMPFAGINIPSIQLPILEGYLKDRNIDIKTHHLYLKAAEFYGLNNYNCLIFPPNDSYSAQMVYSRYVFPTHWKENEKKFREFFISNISINQDVQNNLSFDNYVQKTDIFYNWIIEQVDWKNYDIIGFTLNYGQFLPSLAFAKKIKELNPEKKIVFGGSRTVGKLGIRVLNVFDYVDFIISGDGEEPLYHLAFDYQNYSRIPSLIYRDGEEIIWNKSNENFDLNSLSTISFDSFYQDLSSTTDDIKQYFTLFGRLPIEISRGCWWNKCTFCNLNIQYEHYKEKKVDKIVEEIKFLSDRYKVLSFQMIGNTLPKKNHRLFLEKIKSIGKDLSFFVEARAGYLKSEDYILLKEAGFTVIQTGIESFSQNYIKKMNKGARIIDNIATLKFCTENEIINQYNIIVNYPNEERIDFKETKENIQFFKQFLPPPQISNLIVEFGSAIYNNSEDFNIEKLEYTNNDKVIFPPEILEKEISFYYNFKTKNQICKNNWENLIEDWKKIRNQHINYGIKTQEVLDKLVFYFADGGNFLKIFDKRNDQNVRIYILNDLERKVLLSCQDIISFQELSTKLSNIPDHELGAILHTFEENGIVFCEDNNYLSLPLNYSQIIKKSSKIKSQELNKVQV